MGHAISFEDFLIGFFDIFTQKTFRRVDYLTYLNQPDKIRSNDEAPIVDMAIVSPLLDLLGFASGERVYNQQRQNGRPDFAPADPVYGTCFMVEDKNTALELTLDLTDPESHLSQLAGYVRSAALRLGLLTNGRRLMAWSFVNLGNPECIIDLDIPAAIRDWQNHNAQTLSPSIEKPLHDLFDLCRKESFADMQRLERELGTSLEEWQAQALPLGTGKGNEWVLVEELQLLVMELQRDARRILDHHLARYAEYADKIYRLADDAPESAVRRLKDLRSKVMAVLDESYQKVWGMEAEDIEAIENILIKLEQDSKAFFGPKEVLAAILRVINEARRLKYADRPKAAQPMSNLDDVPTLSKVLQTYSETVFEWHKRQATLNHDYQADRNTYEDYILWYLVVKDTMLEGLNEEQHRDTFALHAVSLIFLRLFLIRVCEDKGIFPQRLISSEGLKHWQENIERYWIFAQGNPYDPLLQIAYENVQNIYPQFFSMSSLFKWYRLDQQKCLIALRLLKRFDFAKISIFVAITLLLDAQWEKGVLLK